MALLPVLPFFKHNSLPDECLKGRCLAEKRFVEKQARIPPGIFLLKVRKDVSVLGR